jgi:hypothetical protein
MFKPGLAGRPGTRPTRGWNRAELKKKQGKKKPGVTQLTRRPGWPGKTRWLVFLLKRRRFDLKKKNWPGRPRDPVKTRNPDLRPGRVLKLCLEVFLKKNKKINYLIYVLKLC